MIKTLENIEKDALELPEDQRITLVHRILLSTEQQADSSIDKIWQAEIIRRIEQVDSGATTLHDVSDVFRDLDQRLS